MSTKVRPLSERELKRFLKKCPEWKINKRASVLTTDFTFDDYIKGLIFVARVSVHAEVAKHHPDLTLSYGKVKVSLTTHDLKTLSKLDTDLATKITGLYKKV